MELVWLVPLFPIAAFLAIIFFTNRSPNLSARLAILGMGLSTLLGLWIFFQALATPGLAEEPFRLSIDWFPAGSTRVAIGFLVDPLTAVMLAMVTTVCLAIFIYSQGYMHADPRYSRFFAYISLFASGMLSFVLADNLLLAFLSWEIMGLCSYLLIGFWFERPAAANAAKKAFITTKVGDVLFFLGILLLWFQTGSLAFPEIFPAVQNLAATAPQVVFAAGLLIFAGAVGKSAQFPLHVWLPDAMEGPTPVSALIHAATMVAAGVYLIARTFPIFMAVSDAPALLWVAGIGAFTALFAATIGLAQNDIKRVLAYSTISQLGYMVAALGLGGFVAGIFHLITHAFFKALLFLGAGSVIHGVNTNDMWEMGGLRKKMPLTFWTFLIGALALAGIPPLSGFWSKDEILAEAFLHNQIIWVTLTLAAFLTALYMARQISLAFLGQPRKPEVHPHESPRVMTLPLVFLATVTLLLGLAGVPEDMPVLGPLLGGNLFHRFVGENFVLFEIESEAGRFQPLVAVISIAVATFGLYLGWFLYGRKPLALGQPDPLAKLGPVWTFLQNKWYIDEIYGTLIVRPVIRLADILLSFDLRVVDGLVNFTGKFTAAFAELNRLFDVYVIDGAVNGVGRVGNILGQELRLIQTGRVQNYMLLVLISLLMLAGLFIAQ